MANSDRETALIKLISARQSKLETEKANFNDRMQDIADYVAPHREDIRGNLVKGTKKGTKIFDGTAVSAAVIATDGIHGYHISPAFPWFKYKMNRKAANEVKEVREWLEDVEFVMYTALNRSNFYSEAWSWIYDGFTLGTAPIGCEEDIAEDRIVFESIHPGEIFIQENKSGEVDLIHRKRKITARKLVQMFGIDAVGESVKNAYRDTPFTDFEVIHAVFPREEFDERKKLDAKSKRFASVWWLKSGNLILKESGFESFPIGVWRYMKSGKEPYGLSPAALDMADIKGLNLMSKTLLGAAQLAVDPAYNVPSYLEGKVRLKPRGLNYLDGQDKITPVNTGSNFPVGIDREQAKQRAIKEVFHVDTFLMLSQIAGEGQRTAYEVSELMAEKAAILGAELGPLNTELDRLLDRVYGIEVAAGRMSRPPDVLYEMASYDPSLRFDPVYMGPLAQAQREKFHKDGLKKFFTDLAPLAQASPEVLDNFDLDEAARILADSNNIPASITRSKEERDAIRNGRLQAQQQESMLEAMNQGAGALKNMAQADQASGNQLSGSLSNMMGVQRAA